MVIYTIKETLKAENTDTVTMQNALKLLDKKLRAIRKDNNSEALRCTDVLRNINYAVNVFYPKNKRLTGQLCKDAMKTLRIVLSVELGNILTGEGDKSIKDSIAAVQSITEERDKVVSNLESEITVLERKLNHQEVSKGCSKPFYRVEIEDRLNSNIGVSESIQERISEIEEEIESRLINFAAQYREAKNLIDEANIKRVGEFNTYY